MADDLNRSYSGYRECIHRHHDPDHVLRQLGHFLGDESFHLNPLVRDVGAQHLVLSPMVDPSHS